MSTVRETKERKLKICFCKPKLFGIKTAFYGNLIFLKIDDNSFHERY